MSEYIAMINYITFVVTKIESVSDCCSMSTQQLFKLYHNHGKNKLIFNEMTIRSALC